jgi:UDP-glucose:(heptosyl)LPS alpha-1,3-glucosyltransferase
MNVVQLVRRFGPIGGMEEYVWCLTHALAARSVRVTVVCEKTEALPDPAVKLVTLGTARQKPRWRAHLQFADKVDHWATEGSMIDRVLHSHEMLPQADVFTFHSTPHDQGVSGKWWRLLDPTWHINQWLERRVVCSQNVRRVVPVSALLRELVIKQHPAVIGKMATPIPPGVMTAQEVQPKERLVLGFMGCEWERKGLRQVIAIFRQLLNHIPETRLVLAGVTKEKISPLLAGIEDMVEVLGWVKNKEDFFQRINLLIHPARLEAFGMVVTEAMARCIPVLVSDQTGAASEVDGNHGQVLLLSAPIKDWVDAAQNLFLNSTPEPYRRPWDQVAAEYIEVYKTQMKGSSPA